MESTKERVARSYRATRARKSGSQPARGFRAKSITHRRFRAKTWINRIIILLIIAIIIIGTGSAISTAISKLTIISYNSKSETSSATFYPLSESERDIVERVVTAEAGGESYTGQMMVAQCILNAARKNGIRPSKVVEVYNYSLNRPNPTQSVKDAVAAVFDRGEVAIDAPVMYFYNPALETSDWHESQIFVAEVGGHRFFAERSPAA